MKSGVITILIMIAWSTISSGQQSFFLDSLFKIDLSGIESINLNEQKAAIAQLKHDWGISAGINITNSLQDQATGSVSARIIAKANLWNGGLYSNMKEVETIIQEIKIDSVKGIDRAIANNYGIFFDYLIFLSNKDRIKQIDTILNYNAGLSSYLRKLYYNKLINFDELLSMENSAFQYELLKESLLTYNNIFSNMVADSLLPTTKMDIHWVIDFNGLTNIVEQDSSYQIIEDLRYELIELAYEKQAAPHLFASVGYDLARHRPTFAINFSTNIRTHQKQNFDAEKLKVSNEIMLEKLQKKKELLNIQYEYNYKAKQLSQLHAKLRMMENQQQKNEVKKEVLSLDESIQERQLKLQVLMIGYEIIDLQGQLMIQLLKLKKLFPKMEIGDFIQKSSKTELGRKFPGNRFIVERENQKLSSFDSLFLKQNDIQVITASALIEIPAVIELQPTDYDTRAELEEAIVNIINQESINNFIISDLDEFKALELRTLANQKYVLSSFNNDNN